jgi:hypothetical protein
MLTIPGKLAHVSSTRPNFHHQCGLTNLVRLVRALWRGLNRRPCSQPPSASICRSCLWFATFVVISRHIQTYPDSHSTPKAWADFARASFHVEEGALTKTPFLFLFLVALPTAFQLGLVQGLPIQPTNTTLRCWSTSCTSSWPSSESLIPGLAGPTIPTYSNSSQVRTITWPFTCMAGITESKKGYEG